MEEDREETSQNHTLVALPTSEARSEGFSWGLGIIGLAQDSDLEDPG